MPSTSDDHLIKLENQVQCLMEAYLAPTQTIHVNKISSSCDSCSGPHDTQYCMKNPEQAFVDYASSRTNKVGGMRFTLNHGLRNYSNAANTWKEKLNFNWARSQTFTSPQNGSIFVHSSSYQMRLEKALLDFNSNQEKRLSHLRTQLEQQQDSMIGKINLLWKTISEKLNDVSTLKNIGNSMTPKSIAAISHDEREEIRKKGIKSPSKLLSLKYLSPADTEEEDVSSTNARKLNLGGMMKGKEEEVEEILEEEEDDEDSENFNSFPTMEELTHHEWLLKNPRPPWVKIPLALSTATLDKWFLEGPSSMKLALSTMMKKERSCSKR
ncbi:hypothetical protein Tco_0648988 [Tanacetum coccineum]